MRLIERMRSNCYLGSPRPEAHRVKGRPQLHIIERIHARGTMIKLLDKPYLDLTTPIGRGFIAFLSAMAEDERQRIVKRANDGRTAARKRGVHMGRKRKLTELQQRIARERVAKGESARVIAREWSVAHTTVARLLV